MNNHVFISGFCVAFIAINDVFGITCSTNYSEITGLGDSTFAAPVNGACNLAGYSYVTIDDDFELFYTGFIVGEEVPLCDNGYMSNGSCVSYSTGNCASGNYSTISSDAFVAPVANKCDISGYALTTIPDELNVLYTGMILGDEVALCDNGYMSNGVCTSYTAGSCISGYYDLSTDANTFSQPENPSTSTCPTSYVTYANATRCDHNPGDPCVDLPTPTIGIVWRDNTGSEITSNACYYGEQITLPADPIRTGYIFNGWTVMQDQNSP